MTKITPTKLLISSLYFLLLTSPGYAINQLEVNSITKIDETNGSTITISDDKLYLSFATIQKETLPYDLKLDLTNADGNQAALEINDKSCNTIGVTKKNNIYYYPCYVIASLPQNEIPYYSFTAKILGPKYEIIDIITGNSPELMISSEKNQDNIKLLIKNISNKKLEITKIENSDHYANSINQQDSIWLKPNDSYQAELKPKERINLANNLPTDETIKILYKIDGKLLAEHINLRMKKNELLPEQNKVTIEVALFKPSSQNISGAATTMAGIQKLEDGRYVMALSLGKDFLNSAKGELNDNFTLALTDHNGTEHYATTGNYLLDDNGKNYQATKSEAKVYLIANFNDNFTPEMYNLTLSYGKNITVSITGQLNQALEIQNTLVSQSSPENNYKVTLKNNSKDEIKIIDVTLHKPYSISQLRSFINPNYIHLINDLKNTNLPSNSTLDLHFKIEDRPHLEKGLQHIYIYYQMNNSKTTQKAILPVYIDYFDKGDWLKNPEDYRILSKKQQNMFIAAGSVVATALYFLGKCV